MGDLIHGRDLPSSDSDDEDYNPALDTTGEAEDVAAMRAAARGGGDGGDGAAPDAGALSSDDDDDDGDGSRPAVGRRAAKRARVDAAWAVLGGEAAPPSRGRPKRAPPPPPPAAPVPLSSLCVPLPRGRPAPPPAMPATRAEAAAVVAALGLAPKGDPVDASAPAPPPLPRPSVRPPPPPPASADALALATAALEGAAAAAAPARDAGRVAVSETRRFAGKEVAVTTLVAADDKRAVAASAPASTSAADKAGMDAVLASLAGGPHKVTAVDKTRADWAGFKRAAASVDDELDAYKKSGDAHVARLAFLKRAELAQYERERDARLRGDVRNRGRL